MKTTSTSQNTPRLLRKECSQHLVPSKVSFCRLSWLQQVNVHLQSVRSGTKMSVKPENSFTSELFPVPAGVCRPHMGNILMSIPLTCWNSQRCDEAADRLPVCDCNSATWTSDIRVDRDHFSLCLPPCSQCEADGAPPARRRRVSVQRHAETGHPVAHLHPAEQPAVHRHL